MIAQDETIRIANAAAITDIELLAVAKERAEILTEVRLRIDPFWIGTDKQARGYHAAMTEIEGIILARKTVS